MQDRIPHFFRFKYFRQHYYKQKNNEHKKKEAKGATQNQPPQKRHFCSYLLRFFMWNQGKNIIFHGKNVSFNCGKIFPFVFFTNEIFKNRPKRGINSPSKPDSCHIFPFFKNLLKIPDFSQNPE